jgi:hypothetical protein
MQDRGGQDGHGDNIGDVLHQAANTVFQAGRRLVHTLCLLLDPYTFIVGKEFIVAEGLAGRPLRRGSGLGLLAVVVGMLRIEPVGYPLGRFKVVEDSGERLFTARHDDVLAVRPLHNLVAFRAQSVRSFRAMRTLCPLVIRAAAKTVYSTFYSACDEWRTGMAHSGSCIRAFLIHVP